MFTPIILAGGSGTRLWPMSRKLMPKQFLPLVSQHTMLQETLLRLRGLDFARPIIVVGEDHRFLAAEQLREIDIEADILLEPEGKNTAPAIALAANLAQMRSSGNDQSLLVLAADHTINDLPAFHTALALAEKITMRGKLVTFGIVPTEANTGYGYIKRGVLGDLPEEYSVDAFVEKPDQATANMYFSSGEYLWNSGMFMFRASDFLAELKIYAEDIALSCANSVKNSQADLDFLRIDADEFSKSPADSVDYAVMEKTERASVVSLSAGWSDVGSWSALADVLEKDSHGNAIKNCTAIVENAKDCLIMGDNRLVAALGVNDLVIIDTKDALLVAEKSEVQGVKKIVEQVTALGGDQHKLHRVVHRPWGNYDSLGSGERYQVKRITVKPGEKLSLQKHNHRAEHWIVVSGKAKVTRDEETITLSENESIYLPIGCVHALENDNQMPLELIEVQVGSYLGEDDIIRFEDRYGRVRS